MISDHEILGCDEMCPLREQRRPINARCSIWIQSFSSHSWGLCFGAAVIFNGTPVRSCSRLVLHVHFTKPERGSWQTLQSFVRQTYTLAMAVGVVKCRARCKLSPLTSLHYSIFFVDLGASIADQQRWKCSCMNILSSTSPARVEVNL